MRLLHEWLAYGVEPAWHHGPRLTSPPFPDRRSIANPTGEDTKEEPLRDRAPSELQGGTPARNLGEGPRESWRDSTRPGDAAHRWGSVSRSRRCQWPSHSAKRAERSQSPGPTQTTTSKELATRKPAQIRARTNPIEANPRGGEDGPACLMALARRTRSRVFKRRAVEAISRQGLPARGDLPGRPDQARGAQRRTQSRRRRPLERRRTKPIPTANTNTYFQITYTLKTS
jgi:hypothetical protein